MVFCRLWYSVVISKVVNIKVFRIRFVATGIHYIIASANRHKKGFAFALLTQAGQGFFGEQNNVRRYKLSHLLQEICFNILQLKQILNRY